MDWPSRDLSRRLADWRLCTPHDLERCRPFVKRLVRDLPAFDSVWIDALQQNGVLTPYQAKLLDSPDAERLRVDGYVLTHCIEENAWRGVYRARPVDDSRSLLLTLHHVDPDDRVRLLAEMDGLIATLRNLPSSTINCPDRVEVGSHQLLVVSPDVAGTSLREFLVRRGRFPAAVVLAIARRLTEALSILEDRSVVHGDLRPRNVWLDDDGQIQLLSPGCLPAIMPVFVASQELPKDVSDGVAPERVAGGPATVATDQYALGCLMWQLAAGRPPFATGDVHSKLQSHRRREIPDIRNVAPQLPGHLAEAITRLTRPQAGNRFESFRELLRLLGSETRQDQRALHRFVTSFETEAPAQTAKIPQERPRTLPTAMAAVVVGAATVWLLTSEPASLRRSTPNALTKGDADEPRPLAGTETARPITGVAKNGEGVVQVSATVPPAKQSLELPLPDAAGVIWLKPATTYAARNLKFSGPLSIKSIDDRLARIHVVGSAWDIQAESLRLENVQVDALAAVRMQSAGLSASRCVWTSSNGSALEWLPRDAAAVAPGALQFTDSQLAGTGLVCQSRPSFIRFTNCLKSGPLPLIAVPAAGRAHQALPIHLLHVTVRDADRLLEWSPGERAAGKKIELLTKACVFALNTGGSLFGLSGSLAPTEWERSLSVGGLESLVQTGTRLVDLAPPPGKPRGQIAADRLPVDGLMQASIEFFGSSSADPSTSGLKTTDAIFSVDNPPGIEAGKIPAMGPTTGR